jgi:hypothetical protein
MLGDFMALNVTADTAIASWCTVLTAQRRSRGPPAVGNSGGREHGIMAWPVMQQQQRETDETDETDEEQSQPDPSIESNGAFSSRNAIHALQGPQMYARASQACMSHATNTPGRVPASRRERTLLADATGLAKTVGNDRWTSPFVLAVRQIVLLPGVPALWRYLI